MTGFSIYAIISYSQLRLNKNFGENKEMRKNEYKGETLNVTIDSEEIKFVIIDGNGIHVHLNDGRSIIKSLATDDIAVISHNVKPSQRVIEGYKEFCDSIEN